MIDRTTQFSSRVGGTSAQIVRSKLFADRQAGQKKVCSKLFAEYHAGQKKIKIEPAQPALPGVNGSHLDKKNSIEN